MARLLDRPADSPQTFRVGVRPASSLEAPVTRFDRPSRRLNSTTPDVERLCSLWSEVLGVPAGPDSDLYDLGGHSLLVLKLVDKVQAEFGTASTLEDVLQQTTPRLLCRLLRTVDPAVCNAPGGQNVAEPLDQTLVWLRRLDGHPTFYLSLIHI